MTVPLNMMSRGQLLAYAEGMQMLVETSAALRDQFAMAAMTGLFASPHTTAGTGTIEDVAKTVSDVAYIAADAMLLARKEKDPDLAQNL